MGFKTRVRKSGKPYWRDQNERRGILNRFEVKDKITFPTILEEREAAERQRQLEAEIEERRAA